MVPNVPDSRTLIVSRVSIIIRVYVFMFLLREDGKTGTVDMEVRVGGVREGEVEQVVDGEGAVGAGGVSNL